MKLFYLFLTFFVFFSVTRAQTEKPKYLLVGEKCPNLIFPNLVNSNKSSVRLSDFKGKLVIIDFFGTFCVPCIKALPKMDSFQKRFKDDLQIICVSSENRNLIRDFYTHLKIKLDLSLPFVTEDTTLFSFFKHSYIPFYVIIGKDGRIKAMPPQEMVNEENIVAFIKGANLTLPLADFDEYKENSHRAMLIDEKANDSGLVIYHSILTRYLALLPSSFSQQEYKDTSIRARITVTNSNIGFLYQVAYGRFNGNDRASFVGWNRVSIESKDSSKIKWNDADYKSWRLTNCFSYDLIVPNSFQGDAHDIMREDLKRMYSYEAKIEKRKMKCFVFRRSCGGDNLVSWGGKENLDMNTYYLKMQNAPWKEVLYWLENKFMSGTPLVDETGYDRVSLDINADLTSFKSLATALKQIGVELTEEDKEIDILVIRDKINQN